MSLRGLLHPAALYRGLSRYITIFGWRGFYCAAYALLGKQKKLTKVAPRWSHKPLFVRLNSSDVRVFRQVFVEREYQISGLSSGSIDVIIDAGANIGLTSVYLSNQYPSARIYALEPEESNFQVLLANTAPYPQIRCIKGALWNRDELVSILAPDVSEWAFRVDEDARGNAGDIRGYRLSSLLDSISEPRVSLLKMDIEGAEWEVLSDAEAWIDRVDNIVLELHESIKPGCTELFKKATSAFTERGRSHELTLVCRDRASAN